MAGEQRILPHEGYGLKLMSMAFLVTGIEFADRMKQLSGLPVETYVIISFFSLHALFLVIYVGGVIRRIRYLRYANT